MKETELYPHVKALLESQGYAVKAEIGPADVVALRAGDDDPVIVELKTGFALTLFHQAVARQSITDFVYIAVPRLTGKRFLRALKENKALCRRLGLGLITVRLSDGHTEIHLDPAPFVPRRVKTRKTRLLREFARREGDPNLGGAARTGPLVTAYRQDAVKIAVHLQSHGPSKGADVRAATGVATATQIMAADHYGWFERVSRGVYQLTPQGQKAL
ncbi:DUF2161 domain-containing phosphodiesterase [Marinovum sp.]|uniref:DUF2161 domain-containing phosphodiesterase n=1 Tax=Marinovum sp. TaxID=2024839 RepID=UPI003A92F6C6